MKIHQSICLFVVLSFTKVVSGDGDCSNSTSSFPPTPQLTLTTTVEPPSTRESGTDHKSQPLVNATSTPRQARLRALSGKIGRWFRPWTKGGKSNVSSKPETPAFVRVR